MRRKNVLIFAGTAIAVMSGMILPGSLSALQEQREYGRVSAVEEQYLASSSSVARNASANLTVYERLQLAAGQWESNLKEATAAEMELEDFEAVALAREKIKDLYDSHQYPTDISSQYENWYTWKAVPYKAVDTTFHTYTAYYWEIQFEKYDKSETHRIQMMEDGTIFLAEAYMEDGIGDNIVSAAKELPQTNGRTVAPIDTMKNDVADLLPYDADLSPYSKKMVTWITEDSKSYLLFQLLDDREYLYAFSPSL